MLTKTLALEVASDGILVNAVLPGGVWMAASSSPRHRSKMAAINLRQVTGLWKAPAVRLTALKR